MRNGSGAFACEAAIQSGSKLSDAMRNGSGALACEAATDREAELPEP